MNAGALDVQITIERKVVTQDAVYGEQQATWLPQLTEGSPPVAKKEWAQITPYLPASGRIGESDMQGLIIERKISRLRMRWRMGPDSSMRVRAYEPQGDVVYQIIGGPSMVLAEGRYRILEMLLERFSTSGEVES